jgi:hypothetical protein
MKLRGFEKRVLMRFREQSTEEVSLAHDGGNRMRLIKPA